MRKHRYDVVIVGGAVTGSSVAYFLAANPDFNGSVALVEMDPTFSKSATALSSSSIRHQFSTAINVQISQFGTQFIREFAETMRVNETKPDLFFRENGYLFLAETEEQEQILRANHEVQVSCGADVVLFANGFTGYGLQQSPVIGRGISEMITYGECRSLDLSPLKSSAISHQANSTFSYIRQSMT